MIRKLLKAFDTYTTADGRFKLIANETADETKGEIEIWEGPYFFDYHIYDCEKFSFPAAAQILEQHLKTC